VKGVKAQTENLSQFGHRMAMRGLVDWTLGGGLN